MPKIIITGRNFTEPDDGALQMLKNAGYEVIDLGKLGMAHGTPEKEVAEAVKDADRRTGTLYRGRSFGLPEAETDLQAGNRL